MTTTLTDTFDGAAGGLVSSRSGWRALAGGGRDVLQVDGAGALKYVTYPDWPISVGHDTGSMSNYVKAVIGDGFKVGNKLFFLALSMTEILERFSLAYETAEGALLLRGRRADGSTSVISPLTTGLTAGDEIYFGLDALDVITVKFNGVQVYSETAPSEFTYPTTETVGIKVSYDGAPETLDVLRSFEAGTLTSTPPVDTTPPTLTLPTVTATGTTTVIGGITTNEAGPAWAILSTSATKPTAAQIKAGQSHLGVASPAATATLVVGTNTGVFAFSGLAPTTGYFLHVVQDDTTVPANTSTVASSATVTTDTPPPEEVYPIITLPVLKNNTGTLLADVVGATVHVYAVATGNKVVTKTGQTSNASAVMAVTDPALVAGTEYRCVIVLASGAEGLQKATAA